MANPYLGREEHFRENAELIAGFDRAGRIGRWFLGKLNPEARATYQMALGYREFERAQASVESAIRFAATDPELNSYVY